MSHDRAELAGRIVRRAGIAGYRLTLLAAALAILFR